ncbi:MAG TPA: hypothetical protein VIV07_05790 [Sphingomicrobium sp.]
MKHILLFGGALALAIAAPAAAKHGTGYGPAGCPPGLAKKGCMPPGQAKKLYAVGELLPLGSADPYAFGQIPPQLRTQYGLSPYGSYYYGNGYLYRVDPRTLLIQQVIAAVLR